MSSNSATAFRNISVVLTGTSFGLASTLHKAITDVDSFSGHIKASGAELSKWATLARGGVAAAGVAVALSLKDAVTAAANFQTQMQNVNSISFLSSSQLATLSQQVVDLSKTLPQSATTLASGLYDIASSGFQGADGLTVLKASAQAASAGLSTTATSAQAITAVLNAYGLGADQAGKVSDALFQTVNLGVVTFDQLAGSIGDVVGIASQAGISINDVGAAIATMTLSGISADEASTSLNRVIQGLIQPSDALSVVYKQLGYQSGLTALQTKGLHGVMEDLQKATGGNANAMLALFPDIRAVRGALALLTQQGQLYTKQQEGLAAASDGVGATQRALVEQSKAASFQFHIFVNDIQAGAITIGERLLPLLVDLLHGFETLASKGIHDITGAIHALAPTWRALESIGINVVDVLHSVAKVAGPAAAGLLALGSGATIATLNTLLTTLADLTGFLADHKTIVAAVAALYLAKFIPVLALAATNLLKMAEFGIASGITKSLAALGVGAGRATVAVTGLAGAFTLANVATGGIGLALGLLAGGMAALANDTAKAKAEIDKLTENAQPADFKATQGILDRLQEQARSTLKVASQSQSLLGRLHAGEQLVNPFETNTIDAAASRGKAAVDAYQQLADQLQNVKLNARAAAVASGAFSGGTGKQLLTVEQQFANLARSAGIDLTQPLSQSGDAVQQLAAKWKSLHDTVGGGIDQMVSAGQVDVDQLQAIAQAISDAGDAASKSFGSAEDIIGGFQLSATADDVTKAQATLKKAQDDATKAAKAQDQTEAKLAGKRKLTVAQQQQLSNAQDKVTTATQAVTAAQQDLADVTTKAAHPDQQYKQFLSDQLKQAQDFVTGVQQATKRGLNPQTVAQLLAAGPQAAAPVLQAIAADQSGNLIKLVNQTQTTLASLNQQTVEDARLTQQAIQSTSDQMSKDLANALSIDNLEIGSGGALSADDVAKKLGITVDVANRIGTEFGITFAQAASKGISPIGNGATPGTPGHYWGVYASQVPQYKAGGGMLDGPGTATSDSIPVMASRGEYVVRASSVVRYGSAMFDAYNAERVPRQPMPRFFAGGMVGGGSSGYGPQTVTHQTIINVEQVVTPDPNGFIREMDRRKQLANLSGRASG